MRLAEPPPETLDCARFTALARQHLLAAPVTPSLALSTPSDFDLNPDGHELEARLLAGPALVPAAVLVPVCAHPRPTVILTERTAHLSAHAGQIAFPGGKIDPGDHDARAAALREAFEEIGLDPSHVEPLGYLEPYRTSTGYLITPVVALVKPAFNAVPDPSEVADVFEVPLSFLMDPANHRIDTRPWRGAERRFYAIPYEQRYIWGVTAGILKAMHRRLFTP